jgi:hypothetical protein
MSMPQILTFPEIMMFTDFAESCLLLPESNFPVVVDPPPPEEEVMWHWSLNVV